MATICAYAQFVASKVGLDGLAPTWNVEQVTRLTGARAALITGGATSIVVGRNGLYGYVLAGADLTLYDYVFTAITADATVDQQELAAMWTLWSLSWHDILTTALTAVGSIGKLLVDNINATIGSRSTLTQANILSDATPFAGGDIDVAISTRGTANAGDAMTLTGAERIATAGVFLATILEGAHTVADGLRIMLAALAGRSTGGGTLTNRFRDVANVKNRIDATVDANGDRLAITIDGT